MSHRDTSMTMAMQSLPSHTKPTYNSQMNDRDILLLHQRNHHVDPFAKWNQMDTCCSQDDPHPFRVEDRTNMFLPPLLAHTFSIRVWCFFPLIQ